MRQINKIVIHCAATANGKPLGNSHQTAAQVIDNWHAKRGFKRQENNLHFNPRLPHIGYHFVIDTDGLVESGRAINEIGAHVKGHNHNSIGICLIGGVGVGREKAHGRYTVEQWNSLANLLSNLAERFPHAEIYGHRDLSPDLNDDGVITQNEWLKTCPNFDVASWLDQYNGTVNYDHLYTEG
ncbi:N-acetylmuramoyl-L-alanine amidase [Mergibacter septicus]|uniref:N-acetylmuramoyl-L-alanine amidase n=1 Tax=Mergibacter septicus TaxID=221402 RepID=A0A8D4LNS4_9PAST|nr:N-acetylmuramoyl-L-alanine amidase [Mergibacter septicus]AWX15216.1 N-acetylmuramoyl-L-alanine amidase [Mergibacter septicus]QDJ14470.1 N-acetylmuramoyl-L-alanine amidase [Mergibacter septicus]UTU48092.1 N-acetylmuramoyl-L-alanine amidase [Mergibacter septicus]WMR96295.1 N-acetylmuramoyl-L-alanine amidase [Mergibacter septicus]